MSRHPDSTHCILTHAKSYDNVGRLSYFVCETQMWSNISFTPSRKALKVNLSTLSLQQPNALTTANNTQCYYTLCRAESSLFKPVSEISTEGLSFAHSTTAS